VHEIPIGVDRGETQLYYAVARFKGGEINDFEIMTPSEIEAIRKRSKAKDKGPWVTDFDEMAKKTVLKRLLKRLPMSSENYALLAKAIDEDNRAAMGEAQSTIELGSDIIDISASEAPKSKSKIEQDVPVENIEQPSSASDKDRLLSMIDESGHTLDKWNVFLRSKGMPFTISVENHPIWCGKAISSFEAYKTELDGQKKA
jgi:recombinational DNA repair protein RecT